MITEVFVKLLPYWSYALDLVKIYCNIFYMYSTFISKLTIRNFKISWLQGNQLIHFKQCTTEFPVTRFIVTSCALQWNFITVNYIFFHFISSEAYFCKLTENSWHLVYNHIVNCFSKKKNACVIAWLIFWQNYIELWK